MSSTSSANGTSEVTILARVLANETGKLSVAMARHLLKVGFSDQDKARMHELALRNQEDALAPNEKEELSAYVKAGTLLSILKAKARRTLRVRRNTSRSS